MYRQTTNVSTVKKRSLFLQLDGHIVPRKKNCTRYLKCIQNTLKAKVEGKGTGKNSKVVKRDEGVIYQKIRHRWAYL